MFYLGDCCTNVDNAAASGQHQYAYAYDKVGNRTSMTVTHNNNPAETHAYTYDSIYQVTGVDYPSGFDPNLATDTTFAYDAAGNRTSVSDDSGTCDYTANPLNQHTQTELKVSGTFFKDSLDTGKGT